MVLAGDDREAPAAQRNLFISWVRSAGAEPRDAGSLSSAACEVTQLLRHVCNRDLPHPRQRLGKLSSSHQPRQDLAPLLSSRLQGN